MTMRGSKIAAIAADRNKWEKQAFAACVAAARDLIADTGPIRINTPVGRLTEGEWGWVCSTVVWAWIATRAEQAANEGWDEERAIRAIDAGLSPWDAGAIAAILPKLPELCGGVDWSKPVSDWSKDEIVEFIAVACALTARAFAARDASEAKIAGATSADIEARRLNAAAGNQRMTPPEFNDDVPF